MTVCVHAGLVWRNADIVVVFDLKASDWAMHTILFLYLWVGGWVSQVFC